MRLSRTIWWCKVLRLPTIAKSRSLQTRGLRCRLEQLGKHDKELLLGRLAIEDAPEVLIADHLISVTMPCPFAPVQQQAWRGMAISLIITEDAS